MERDGLRKIGSTRFTDGSEHDVFEDAEGRQHARGDDGELVAGQWLPLTDEAVIVETGRLQ